MLAERALARSKADATGSSSRARRALTRFTHEAVHQNVDLDDTSVRIRAIVDGRSGVASTNAVDDDALAPRRTRPNSPVSRRARRFRRRSRVRQPLPRRPVAWVDRTARATPDDRAGVAARIFEHAQRNGCWSAGYVTTSAAGLTIATSAGARLSFDGTSAGANVKMTATDSTGFAERYAPDSASLDGNALGARAAAKARSSATPVAVDPGEWTVILEPAAIGELLVFLDSHFSAQSFQEGSSFLAGRLGERVMGDGVTIRDDYAH